MQTLQERFIELREKLTERHIERYDEVEIMLISILTGYHSVLVGPPGTAKSMLAEDMTRVFDVKLFKWLFTKFTTPEEIFGPFNLALLKEGRYERIVDRKAPTAHICFYDEVFKANSAILNSQLTLMNERLFDNGTERIKCPLISVIAASNELPEGEELNALFDRFHFRKKVDYIHEPGNFVRMLKLTGDYELPTFTLDELHEAQAEVRRVTIGRDTRDTMVEIRSAMQMEGLIASDRRYFQSQLALKAMAWLYDRPAVGDDDFRILEHMLWSEPSEIKRVSRVILSKTNPIDQAANEIIDEIDDIAGNLTSALMDAKARGDDDKSTLTKQGIEWFTKCRTLSSEIKRLERKALEEGRPLNKIEQAKDRVLAVANEIGTAAIGLEVEDLKFRGRGEDEGDE
jgi:MoxR-like ATPase